MIEITKDAAEEISRLVEAKQSEVDGIYGLRLFVEKGGCAGMQYAMQVAEQVEGDQEVNAHEARVWIAADSTEYLSGCHLDYVDALSDAGFKITNPNAARSCGCGTSFEPGDAGKSSDAELPENFDEEACLSNQG